MADRSSAHRLADMIEAIERIRLVLAGAWLEKFENDR